MSRFVQLHYLTIYPPSNPNRDDVGRPKSASYGGVPRLRISSQALKRAARLSEVMQRDLEGHLGTRTQRIGEVVRDALDEDGTDEEKAAEVATKVADVFGKIDARAGEQGAIRTRQLAFVSPEERDFAIDLARRAIQGEALPNNAELKKMVLRTADGAADVAMFGRMLADDPNFNREAAVQVSHAITTHRALVEDDFYNAADDLKTTAEDSGAGFLGDAGFGSGVFYLYACVDTDLLVENLAGDRALAARSVGALAEALAISTPAGKRNAFAHHTRASHIRAESGSQQPRSLAGAFLSPVSGGDVLASSVAALEDMADKIDAAYGDCADSTASMNVPRGEGSLTEIRDFAETFVRDV
ncbi:type I-E CRISPR-associated protein Cas7/Cse4/CasC [Roseovarius salinarum]|uniref:type I-E CRISPR-associated protein Cas7/Cse4/CasC n=1 Tax=Roseovarius salinarum TaxID=1981892 RepID=UPI000C335545|nr:type I-E CRISPR-associated protein Cas7/Cse4/CasC [Roseovarius salinarum]